MKVYNDGLVFMGRGGGAARDSGGGGAAAALSYDGNKNFVAIGHRGEAGLNRIKIDGRLQFLEPSKNGVTAKKLTNGRV